MGDIQSLRPMAGSQNLVQSSSERSLRTLSNGAGSDPTSKAKIEKAARDFEGVLLGQWLEQAEKSFATVPGGDPDQQTDPGHDQLQSIALQSLAGKLTRSGGLGIASMIVKNLTNTNKEQATQSVSEAEEGTPRTPSQEPPATH